MIEKLFAVHFFKVGDQVESHLYSAGDISECLPFEAPEILNMKTAETKNFPPLRSTGSNVWKIVIHRAQ
jgi:hypothetical protein